MAYDFKVILHPWGNNPERGTVGVDEDALYGYWEHKDGSEGGGLWFSHSEDGPLDLVDFDGDYGMPRAVIDALRLAGFRVDEIFE